MSAWFIAFVAFFSYLSLQPSVSHRAAESEKGGFGGAEWMYYRANAYFDATHPDQYDMERAKRMYEEVLRAEPALPYVRHQLARIAFLEGDFDYALALLDEEIMLFGDGAAPSSYYVRGLVKGFARDFDGAAADYEEYLKHDPSNWAAINDYAWVLLKMGRSRDAAVATAAGLRHFPDNPWLLNSSATALYELGFKQAGLDQARKAARGVLKLSEDEWLKAYPGNDPLIAREGMYAFQDAVRGNVRHMTRTLESYTQ